MKTEQEIINEITQEEFDNMLTGILENYNALELIHIPGVYELVAEDFNNFVLDAIVREKLEEEE